MFDGLVAFEYGFDQFGDDWEADFSGEEQRNRLFVSSHQYRWIGTPMLRGFQGQSEAGEARCVEGFEVEARYFGPA